MRRWMRWWLGIEGLEPRLQKVEGYMASIEGAESAALKLTQEIPKKQDELNQMFQQLRDMKSELQANSRQVIKTRGWREFAAQMERD